MHAVIGVQESVEYRKVGGECSRVLNTTHLMVSVSVLVCGSSVCIIVVVHTGIIVVDVRC